MIEEVGGGDSASFSYVDGSEFVLTTASICRVLADIRDKFHN